MGHRLIIAAHLLGVIVTGALRRSSLPFTPEWEAMAVNHALSLTDRLLSRNQAGQEHSQQGEGSGATDPSPGGGEKTLTEHQRRVGELIAIFEQFGASAPRPGVVAHWLKIAGFDAVRDVLLDLGGRGHLDKGTPYVYQVLLSRAEMAEALEQVAQAGPTELADGTGLPGGQRWSSRLGQPVPAADWKPIGEESE